MEKKNEEKGNKRKWKYSFEGGCGIQLRCSTPLTFIKASPQSFYLFFTFFFSLSLLMAACVSLLECFPALPPPHSTPTLTVFLGTALKNKCTPTVSIWTIGIWQGFVSIRLSHLKESATQKWVVVEVVGVSIFYEVVQSGLRQKQLWGSLSSPLSHLSNTLRPEAAWWLFVLIYRASATAAPITLPRYMSPMDDNNKMWIWLLQNAVLGM